MANIITCITKFAKMRKIAELRVEHFKEEYQR